MGLRRYVPDYNYQDYLSWQGSWELWDGVAVAMTPSPFGPHQRLIAKLCRLFLQAIEEAQCNDCEVYCELDWVVSENTVVRPDLSLVCGGEVDRFIEEPPSLIVEVISESTSDKDRTVKRELYERMNVKYYFLIDPNDQSLNALELRKDNYAELSAASPIHLELHPGCRIEFDISKLKR